MRDLMGRVEQLGYAMVERSNENRELGIVGGAIEAISEDDVEARAEAAAAAIQRMARRKGTCERCSPAIASQDRSVCPSTHGEEDTRPLKRPKKE